MKALRGLVLLLLAAGTANTLAQSRQPRDARDLLSRVAATYRNLNSFEWVALSTVTLGPGEYPPVSGSVVGAFRRPHFMRLDRHGKGLPSENTSITDGENAWLYYKRLNWFCRPDPKTFLQHPIHDAMLTLDRSLPFERILTGLRSARVIGNRVLKIGSKNVLCVVVTAVYAPAKSSWTGRVRTDPITFWIDITTNIVVQQSFQTVVPSPTGNQPRMETWTMTIMRYSINPELPDSRFTFRPAAGIPERPCTASMGGG